jgi:lactoylglutathione lyase
MSIAINLVVLRSRDLERSVSFYSRLGLIFVKEKHGNGSEHYAASLLGSIFEIYPVAANGIDTLGTRIGFTLASIDNAISNLSDFPNSIFTAAHNSEWGYRAVVVDPDGHKVELSQR